MPMLRNILIGTGVTAGIAGIIAYARRMNRTSAQLESVVKAQVHKLGLDGITIRIDATLKNPTNGTLTIKYPFVKLAYNGNIIGTSKVIDQDIVLPKHGEANIEAIMINIPVLGMLSLGMGLYEIFAAKKDVEVNVVTVSTIDLGWRKMPYEKTDKINLNPST